MKLFVLMSLFVASFAFAGEQLELDFGSGHCIGSDQAKVKLTEYLGQSPVDTVAEDFPFIDEGDLEKIYNMPAKQLLDSIVGSLSYDKIFENYQTETVASGYCAPAAECWGWYVVSCQGQVEARADGED